MPTPRKHANHAQRQRAYILRQKEAQLAAQAAKNLPATATIPTMPSIARWNALRYYNVMSRSCAVFLGISALFGSAWVVNGSLLQGGFGDGPNEHEEFSCDGGLGLFVFESTSF